MFLIYSVAVLALPRPAGLAGDTCVTPLGVEGKCSTYVECYKKPKKTHFQFAGACPDSGNDIRCCVPISAKDEVDEVPADGAPEETESEDEAEKAEPIQPKAEKAEPIQPKAEKAEPEAEKAEPEAEKAEPEDEDELDE